MARLALDSKAGSFIASKQSWFRQALMSAEIMKEQGIPTPRDQVYSLLRDCTKQDIESSRRVHSLMAHGGLDSVAVLANHLIRVFSARASLVEANDMFTKISKPCEQTWSAIIAAHAKLGQGEVGFELYHRMLQSDMKSNQYLYVAVLQACVIALNLDQGKHIHQQIIANGVQSDLYVGNALVDMYAKCGNLEKACRIFNELPNRDAISWNAMISGYIQHGEGNLALKCYENMQNENVSPDEVTFSSILKACATTGALDQGRDIHRQIIKSELHSNTFVGNTLIDMYSKCGNLEEARKIFDEQPARDMVSWNSMIGEYAQHGEGSLALECFDRMQDEGFKPDKVAFVSVLKACASIGAIDQGKRIHKQIVESELQSDPCIGSTLVGMYAKSGNLEEACKIFDELLVRDVVSWGAIIAGYAQSGNVAFARQCLENMYIEGIEPDRVIFATIFGACSHAGLVDEGYKFFKSMIENYEITPDTSHINCVADLLGRAGHLNEAEEILQTNQSNLIGWISLLTACRTYGNVEIGRGCFDRVIQLDPQHASAYVLMSGIYSDAQLWSAAAKIEERRQHLGAWKKPAKAWIEVNNKVHEFIVGDKSHPQSEEIYAMLKRLSDRMKDSGYAPKVDLVLQQMSEADKEDALCGHCEKLAVAFGIASTPPGTIIRATKNLRVCMDCHNATKIISKIENREIIIKDGYRLHHFKNGSCSCGDYY